MGHQLDVQAARRCGRQRRDGGDAIAVNSNTWDISSAGAITSATWNGNAVGAGYGGTGIDTSAAGTGAILRRNAAGNAWETLAAGSAGQSLSMSGGVPTWGDNIQALASQTNALYAGTWTNLKTVTITTATGSKVLLSVLDEEVTVSSGKLGTREVWPN